MSHPQARQQPGISADFAAWAAEVHSAVRAAYAVSPCKWQGCKRWGRHLLPADTFYYDEKAIAILGLTGETSVACCDRHFRALRNRFGRSFTYRRRNGKLVRIVDVDEFPDEPPDLSEDGNTAATGDIPTLW